LEQSGLTGFPSSAPHEVEIEMSMEFNEFPGRPVLAKVLFKRPQPGQQSITELGGRQLLTQLNWELIHE
jgi:hypothetical protein